LKKTAGDAAAAGKGCTREKGQKNKGLAKAECPKKGRKSVTEGKKEGSLWGGHLSLVGRGAESPIGDTCRREGSSKAGVSGGGPERKGTKDRGGMERGGFWASLERGEDAKKGKHNNMEKVRWSKKQKVS